MLFCRRTEDCPGKLVANKPYAVYSIDYPLILLCITVVKTNNAVLYSTSLTVIVCEYSMYVFSEGTITCSNGEREVNVGDSIPAEDCNTWLATSYCILFPCFTLY